MKKDIFNFKRFGKYFVTDARTCAANFGLSLVTLSVLTITALYILHVGFSLIFGNGWNGPDAGFRFFVFIMVMICLIVTMPKKCYGKLTEKQYGSQWLMVPTSKTEKFVSMILLTCIIVPVIGAMCYLGYDALICSIDHTCGNSLISWGLNLEGKINEIIVAEQLMNEPELENFMNFMVQIKNPWLYIDDSIQMTLPFLLGALWFKSGKTAKTFLAIFAAGIAVSIISTPLAMKWSDVMVTSITGLESSTVALEIFNENWLFKNIVLVDTISDTLVNLALLAAIYFRIGTLKH